MMQKKKEKLLNPWHMGTHLRTRIKSYPMNTNMTGSRWFSKKYLHSWAFDKSIALALEGLNKQLQWIAKIFQLEKRRWSTYKYI